jgi:hypothetical protein
VYPGLETPLAQPELAILVNPLSRPGGSTGAYLGLSILALALAGAATAFLRRQERRPAAPAVVCLALVAVLAFLVPLWQPTRVAFTAGLPGIRFLVFFVFFAAVLAGTAFSWLESRTRNPAFRLSAFLVVSLLIGFDCLPHLLGIRHDQTMRFLDVRSDAYRLIAEDSPAKVLDLYNHQDRIDDYRRLACFPAIGYLYGHLATPYGPAYYQFASKAMRYTYPWANLVAADLGDTSNAEVSPDALKALALLGVSHLITTPSEVRSDSEGTLYTLKPGIEWDDRFLRAHLEPPLTFGPTGAGLVLVSNAVVPVPSERLVRARSLLIADDWQELLDALQVEPGSNRVNFIPVTAEQAGMNLPTDPAARIIATSMEDDRASVTFEADAECYVRLALSYYPELRVALDRRPVRFFETKDHFIWFRCPEGTHHVEVTAPLTPLRRNTLYLSGLALLVCLAALLPRPRNRRRPSC